MVRHAVHPEHRPRILELEISSDVAPAAAILQDEPLQQRERVTHQDTAGKKGGPPYARRGWGVQSDARP